MLAECASSMKTGKWFANVDSSQLAKRILARKHMCMSYFYMKWLAQVTALPINCTNDTFYRRFMCATGIASPSKRNRIICGKKKQSALILADDEVDSLSGVGFVEAANPYLLVERMQWRARWWTSPAHWAHVRRGLVTLEKQAVIAAHQLLILVAQIHQFEHSVQLCILLNRVCELTAAMSCACAADYDLRDAIGDVQQKKSSRSPMDTASVSGFSAPDRCI